MAELPELAAAYGYGIARNHPFVDGNKRTSLLAIYTFLGLNGSTSIVPEAEAAAMILRLPPARSARKASRAGFAKLAEIMRRLVRPPIELNSSRCWTRFDDRAA